MITFKQKQYSDGDKEFFITYINQLEGVKTRIKNLHWAAPKNNIHQYLDEFLDIVSDFQDTVAETYMGILGKMGPLDINGIGCDTPNAMALIERVTELTKRFYEGLPEGVEFKGIGSETETFVKDCEKYKYLFSLCDNNYEGN